MSRSPRWLILPLLLLALGAAAPASAAPEPPSAATFLATLSDTPPCLAEGQASVPAPELPLQVPEAQNRVIYPDCGYYCSDVSCGGRPTLAQCTTETGAAGFCKGVNQVCSGEPMHSPCFCKPY